LSYIFARENIFYDFDTKNGLGQILADFFTNSSGHPECNVPVHWPSSYLIANPKPNEAIKQSS
jgi:hypothetical protein